MRFIREYIGDNHEFAAEDTGFHQVEFLFSCEPMNPSEIGAGQAPDEGQLNVAWLDIGRLEEYRLYPMAIRGMIKDQDRSSWPVYLGDVN